MFYLILLFTILFFFLAWRRLDWAVMLAVAAMPAYLIRFNILGLPSTLLEVMIWAVFLVWGITNWTRIKENLREACKKNSDKIKIRYPFDWEIILLLLVAFAAAGVAGFNTSSLGVWKAYFFEPAMLFVVALNVIKGEKGREKIIWALAVSALAVSALAIYQKITGQLIDNPLWAAEATRRVVSFFGYPNAVGLYLGPLVLVFTGWLMSAIMSINEVISQSKKNPKLQALNPRQITSTKSQTKTKNLFGNWDLGFDWKLSGFVSLRKRSGETTTRSGVARGFGIWNFQTIFIGLTIISSTLAIYFAKSKGALMGVVAGLIVFGLLAGKKIRWATVAIVLLTAASLLAYQPARKLALDTITFKTLSGQIRLAGWQDSWTILKDGRLLTGAGLANFQAAVTPYHTEGIFIKDFSDPDAQRKLVFNEAYRTAHWQPLEIYLYPHNIILNFWSELGLAGVLLFIWIIGKFLVIGLWDLFGNWKLEIGNLETQKNKFIIIGSLSAMTAIIVHGLVDVPYFKNDLAVMFWLFIAMMSLINLEIKYGKNNL